MDWLSFLTVADIKTAGIGLVLTFVTLVVNRLFKHKARVRYSHTHGFMFLVPVSDPNNPGQFLPNSAPYYTQTFMIQNFGRAAAEKVEVIFNYPPAHMEIWPPAPYTEEEIVGGRYCVKFDHISPNEHFSIEIIGTSKLPGLVNVRTLTGEGKEISTRPERIYPKPLIFCFQAFTIGGLFLYLYLVVRLVTAIFAGGDPAP